MKNISAVSALALVLTAAQAEAKEITCRNVERYHDEGALTVKVTLTATQGKISQVAIEKLTEVYATKTGYTCNATLKNGVTNNKWEVTARETLVSVDPDESGEPSSLIITRAKDGYILKTNNLSKAACGARTEWPAQVFVPLAGGKCKVVNQ